MAKVVVFANQKGGVGKTTTTVNIGAYLAEAGHNVLLVDFDPQGNLSSSLGITDTKNSIYEAMMEQIPVEKAVQKTPQKNLDILPSNLNLSGATVELSKADKKESLQYLKKTLSSLKSHYDYILIDCPPSLGVLTINGFIAADTVIIPLQCEYFALEGLKYMYSMTIKRIQKSVNPDLKIGGIIFTMYDSRTNLGKEVIKSVQETFKQHPEMVFHTVIPRNIRLSEAPSHGLPINLYDAACIGAKCYEKLTEEVIARV
ncbi:ParA family protein [Oceanispirochaeta crateris]|uniref:ParA family protein n=1 Tax=Oceanispirochaeta crateris TaxID=2518645 RepID=A0A5C1QQ22_9SPIO|nr:AAA family ATPase [Oceanispirochaeta crateris]QEN09070.1 ParA family protein [Oceanispirochaeta crateris]